jgi:hypothetical protein
MSGPQVPDSPSINHHLLGKVERVAESKVPGDWTEWRPLPGSVVGGAEVTVVRVNGSEAAQAGSAMAAAKRKLRELNVPGF